MAQRQPASGLPRTVEEFDRWHAGQPERWEFVAGVPVMMAPGSNNHSIIKGNIFAQLRSRSAGGPCRAFVDGPEVKGPGLSAIPDVVVTRTPVRGDVGVVEDPVVVVEVLSPSSERDDTGRKWQGCCLVPSLRHYLVVSQESRFVTAHARSGPASFDERFHQEGAVALDAVGAGLTLAEIYEGVVFGGPPADG